MGDAEEIQYVPDSEYFKVTKPSILENTPSISLIIIHDYYKSILTVCGKFN